ncbi:hypothetical protein [Halanaerobacter jeridensis]|uniref:Uncharacterized protein n=1 Tax=Halanaerobacter jeridensis TaxID=706427 RepID=A0A938XRU2_9FIRM|nr:hypothetical protein [Halanaerobacter jeridensis]MBM7556604.1 hypothetical protein [Halanaerobacter jeridensis]
MNFAGIDLIFALLTVGIIVIIRFMTTKLPETILIKGQDNQIIFSLAKKNIKYLIIGLGLYVWLMEFIIVNELLLLRLITPLLLEGSLFALLIITNLGYRKLGERLTITGFFLFVVSVVYLVL